MDKMYSEDTTYKPWAFNNEKISSSWNSRDGCWQMQITPTRCRKLTCVHVANLPHQDNKIRFVVTLNAEFSQICKNNSTKMTMEILTYLLLSLLSITIK